MWIPWKSCNRRLKKILTSLCACGVVTIFIILYMVMIKLEIFPWNPALEACKYTVQESSITFDPKEITVVTLFLDLGVFKKGDEPLAYHTSYKYRKWMQSFRLILNRVVAYLETDSDVAYFKQIRSCLPSSLTKIIKVERNQLPAFKLLSKIQTIYNNASYPKYYPNTVKAEYTCAVHAKYDVLREVSLENPFHTPYMAWLDIGYFRHLNLMDSEPFKLTPPENLQPESVGFSQAWPQPIGFSAEQIIKDKVVWVAGGMFLARDKVMVQFIQDYQAAVRRLLDQGLSNTDQEVIAAMYTGALGQHQYIPIQTFACHQGQVNLVGPSVRYMCLGYLCKQAGEKKDVVEKPSP